MQQSTNTSLKHTTANIPHKGSSFMDWITQYESLVVFVGFGIAVTGTVILTGIFQAGPERRDNVLYNACGAMAMAIGFIYLIFAFMGSTIVILGQTIDIGMIVYIAIVLFIMFVLGN